ncbi:COG4223 family protein [Paracoccus chinensis]|uniref:Inner membrane protein n=1 Tax=Paracoccus chinensis TaxID=525640 RepID=A0A1G9I376_9RHOB|nr:hypothetical protein [Paracoccus chinensis]SDL19273.1 hypothetical protein SAMN04487971_107115 [Paracoccus chinensis]
MTDRPDDAAPHRRPEPAAPGTALPSHEASAPDSASAEVPPAPPIESALVGENGDRPAMSRRPMDEDSPERPVTIDMPDGGKVDAGAGSEARIEATETRSAIPAVTRPAPPSTASNDAGSTRTPAPRRRGGFMPLFLGGVIAAALGAGAAWWAVPRLPPAWQPAPVANSAGTEALRAEMERQAAEIEARAVEAARQAASEAATQAAGASLADQGGPLVEQARQAGADAAAKLLAEAPAAPGADPSVATTLAAQAQQLATLDEAVTALRSAPAETVDLAPLQSATEEQAARLTALEQTVATLRDTPPVDLAPLQQQFEAQAAQIDELAQRPVVDAAAVERLNALAAEADTLSQRLSTAADEAQARLAEAESRATALAQSAEDAARRAQAASAALAIGEALQTGDSPSAALAQLEDAGVTPPPALTAQVPTLDALVAAFPPAARAAVRASLQAEAAEGQGSIIGNFLRAQTGARSVAPREGSDADAVLSRAGAAVERGQIQAALDELDALPEAARPAMADWTAQAQAYVAAQSALGALVAPAAPATEDAAPDATATPSEAAAQPASAADAAAAEAPPEPEPEAGTAEAPATSEPSAPAAEPAPTGAALRPTPPVITATVPLHQPDTPPADAAAAPSN